MKKYDIHSHFGATSSGEIFKVQDMIYELQTYDIFKVGISCLSGNSMEEQNLFIYNTMKVYPEFIEGYAFITPKDTNSL